MDEIDKLIAEVERLDRERQRLSAAAMVSLTAARRYVELTVCAADTTPTLSAEVKRLNAELREIRQARDTLQAFLSSTSESLDKAREELRAKFSPDAMDLVGQRLVNARKLLDPDAPIWLTLAMDEAWQALAFLRRNSAQQAARIEQQDEEIAKLHDAVTFADQQGAEAIERVSTAIVNDKWNATAAFQARALKAEKERDALHDRIEGALAAALGNPVMSIHDGDGPVADSLESLIALVASEHASVKRIRAEREEFRLSLLAEMGDPDGAPSDRWRCDGRNWYGDRGDGGMDKIEWYATPNGDGTVRHKRVWLDIDMHGFEKERGRFDLSRVAMQAANKALKVGSPS